MERVIEEMHMRIIELKNELSLSQLTNKSINVEESEALIREYEKAIHILQWS